MAHRSTVPRQPCLAVAGLRRREAAALAGLAPFGIGRTKRHHYMATRLSLLSLNTMRAMDPGALADYKAVVEVRRGVLVD